MLGVAVTFAAVVVVFVLSRVRLARLPMTSYGAVSLRFLFRFLPYLLPLGVLGLPSVEGRPNHVMVAVLLGLLPLVVEREDLRYLLDPSFVRQLTPITGAERAYGFVTPLSSVLGQELLYRFALLTTLSDVGVHWLVAATVSTGLFVAEHYVSFTGKGHDRRDLALFVYIGAACSGLFLLSGSVMVAMIPHLMVNAPGSLSVLLRAGKRSRVETA